MLMVPEYATPAVHAAGVSPVNDGAGLTVRLAEAVVPVASFAVMVLVVLTLPPGVVAVTLMVRVPEAPAASVTPDRLTELEPAVALMVPPRLLTAPFGVATTRPAGKA